MPATTITRQAPHKGARMSALAIEKVDVPTLSRPGRERTPNPFTETVKSLKLTTKDAKGEAAAVKVPNSDVPKTVRKLQDAGREAGVTVRTLTAKAGEQHSRITFWPVPKIVKKEAEPTKAAAKPKK